MTLETLIGIQTGLGIYLGVQALYWNWRHRRLKGELAKTSGVLEELNTRLEKMNQHLRKKKK